MKEEIPILQIHSHIISDTEICQLISEFNDNLSSMLILTRNYLFNDITRGHSLSHARNVSIIVDNIVVDIISRLGELSELKNMKTFELGIGFNLQKVTIDEPCARNRLLIDDVGRQIRIPICGKSTFNDVPLNNGAAYIVDNVSGHRFTASEDVVHLIFNYISKDEGKSVWGLWKRKT